MKTGMAIGSSPGRRRGLLAALAVAVLALSGCATRSALAPGQLFPGSLMEIRAPASAGWVLLESDGKGMVFARQGPSAGQSYIAQVGAFPLSSFNTPDEFLAIIKDGVARDTSPERFKNVESAFQLTTERPYPCVRLRSRSDDTQARTPRGPAVLQLHIRSLYCQHPTKRELGFVIAYSQRGGPPDADLDAQAQSFIDGVQTVQPK
jgi:hypothetical protein